MSKATPARLEQLLPLVYAELRRLAVEKMAQERPGQTLQATALVHEAYLRLVDDKVARNWDSRGHFFAAAAEAMRRILVEQARRKQRLKHGGALKRIDFDPQCAMNDSPRHDVLALDEAITRLAAKAPVKAELVKLRYFTGLTMPEAAAATGRFPGHGGTLLDLRQIVVIRGTFRRTSPLYLRERGRG